MSPRESDDPKQPIQEAINGLLEEGEVSRGWLLIVDVALADRDRLVIEAGAGLDGTGPMTIWQTLGLAHAAVTSAEDQLRASGVDDDEDDAERDGHA